MNVPPSLKSIKPFCVRAQQFAEAEPLISYYLHMYALSITIPKFKQLQDDAKKFIVTLMNNLEKQKTSLKVSEVNGLTYCTEVLNQIFNQTLEIDQAGLADKSTAASYDVVRLIVDCTNQFGELNEELKKKRKFAMYRATQILKGNTEPPADLIVDTSESVDNTSSALKQSEEEVQSVNEHESFKPDVQVKDDSTVVSNHLPEDDAPEQSHDLPVSKDLPNEQEFDSLATIDDTSKELPKTTDDDIYSDKVSYSDDVAPVQPLPLPTVSSKPSLDYKSITQAEKYIKWSLSSLQLDDVSGTIKFLEDALSLLKK
ncbi:hypothetical protein GEMRC1_002547 [Eukaryota sp. GEM-RC1]